MAYSIYTLGVPREWPCRLLHIPTMTSRERAAGNTYGPDKEPKYAILSYTWGRFEIPEGPRLAVDGIDWKIPAVNEAHFTVEDLQQVLRQIRLDHEYVWIDVACIDQRREKVKMKEIGRQASIFKLAGQAYVWLNRFEPAVIQQHTQELMRCTHAFASGSMSALQAAREIDESLCQILQDFWFSSLWTLQESVLQRHALILNKRGAFLTTQGPWTGESTKGKNSNTQLMDISGAIIVAKVAIDKAMRMEGSTSPHIARLQALRAVIDESGIDFTFCPNPNIAYSAARFRKTTRPEDRIYGIMQVYGYKLGNSATSVRRTRNFDLEELELQFLKTLTTQSTIVSQSFRHLRVPPPGQSWCITNHIDVPQHLHRIIVHEQFTTLECRISVCKRNEAYFNGLGCALGDLLGLWKTRAQEIMAFFDAFLSMNAPSESKQCVILDSNEEFETTDMSSEWPPDTAVFDGGTDLIIEHRMPELIQASDRQQYFGESIISRYRHMRPSVLYLGSIKHIERMEVALIVIHVGSSRRFLGAKMQDTWRRIGILFWGNYRMSVDNFARMLAPMKGRFG